MSKTIKEIIKEPGKMSDWLTEGESLQLPKTKEINNLPSITCLPKIYEMIASILKDRIVKFIKVKSIFLLEYTGCRKESYGCKVQFCIKKVILENSRSKSKNLSFVWIYYKNTFSYIPNKWILKVLNIFKIFQLIMITFLK